MCTVHSAHPSPIRLKPSNTGEGEGRNRSELTTLHVDLSNKRCLSLFTCRTPTLSQIYPSTLKKNTKIFWPPTSVTAIFARKYLGRKVVLHFNCGNWDVESGPSLTALFLFHPHLINGLCTFRESGREREEREREREREGVSNRHESRKKLGRGC